MDAEKVTEVEMKELAPAEVQDDKDAEKGKVEETQAAEKKEEEKEEEKTQKDVKKEGNLYCKLDKPTEDVYNASVSTSTSKQSEDKKVEETAKEEAEGGNVYCKLKNPTENVYMPVSTSSSVKGSKDEKVEEKVEVDDEETEETSVYCKLKDPSENVYMSAMTSSTAKHIKDTDQKLHRYKRISAGLSLLSLVLLAVVLALAMKLNEVQSSKKCPDNRSGVVNTPSHPLSHGSQCSECGKNWVRFEKSCYFVSKERVNWQKSRKLCQKKGGDLAIITNDKVQEFLTKHFGMLYWIGLHYSENKQWIWIDNSTLTQNYWAQGQPVANPEGSCALLRGHRSTMQTWHSNPCAQFSHYICQKG